MSVGQAFPTEQWADRGSIGRLKSSAHCMEASLSGISTICLDDVAFSAQVFFLSICSCDPMSYDCTSNLEISVISDTFLLLSLKNCLFTSMFICMFVCLNEFISTKHMQKPEGQKELDPLEMELQMVVANHVGAGN